MLRGNSLTCRLLGHRAWGRGDVGTWGRGEGRIRDDAGLPVSACWCHQLKWGTREGDRGWRGELEVHVGRRGGDGGAGDAAGGARETTGRGLGGRCAAGGARGMPR